MQVAIDGTKIVTRGFVLSFATTLFYHCVNVGKRYIKI
ncbi:MAG: hypothetical protein ACI9J4_000462 [Paraglaciecola sp.]|jgi:hypothetical protein